jgi:release factor glutamine methyltransferase
MRVGDLLALGIKELADVGVPEATVDTALLLGFCLGMSRTQLFLAAAEEVAVSLERQFQELLVRRKQREPVSYILGEHEFWSLPFRVNRDVLIPRPETEFLLETALKTARGHGLCDGLILDLCCGSGVIAVVLALELHKRVLAADLSLKALRVAQDNARRHGVEDLVDFVQMDLLTSLSSDCKISMVVSNPPYVSSREMEEVLEPEVCRYEPHLALHGGEGGLEVIKRIRQSLPRILCDDALFFMEIGAEQGASVLEMFKNDDEGLGMFDPIRILPDYAGRDRVVFARWQRRRG